MLSLLQGREHRVHTALCLVRLSRGYRDEAVETTRVRFRPMSREEIAGYAATGECDDKAGAYAVQGMGSLLVEAVHGSFANVVGLPVTRVMELLVRARVARVSRSPRGGREGGGGNPGWFRFGEAGR
jgi:septum formation protein